MNIRAKVNQVVERYGTRDPYEIAGKLCIYVFFENLGTINGYYSTSHGLKFIHINEKLSHKMRELVCAHEIGHAVLHPSMNIEIINGHTHHVEGRYENQANLFASYLLYPDEFLMQFEGFSAEQIAAALEIPKHIITLRC